MNKIKRLLSALMSCVIIAGSLSVAASAAHSPYLDGAVTDKYNTIDANEINALLGEYRGKTIALNTKPINSGDIGDGGTNTSDKALKELTRIEGALLAGGFLTEQELKEAL